MGAALTVCECANPLGWSALQLKKERPCIPVARVRNQSRAYSRSFFQREKAGIGKDSLAGNHRNLWRLITIASP
jgi:hypothetical protein